MPEQPVPQLYCVYAIRNQLTGAMYVGAAVDLRRRWRNHRGLLSRGRHTIRMLQKDWDESGEDGFQLVVLEVLAAKNDKHRALYLAEGRWMVRLANQQVRLYNRSVPKRDRIGVVDWNPETMLPKPGNQ